MITREETDELESAAQPNVLQRKHLPRTGVGQLGRGSLRPHLLEEADHSLRLKGQS